MFVTVYVIRRYADHVLLEGLTNIMDTVCGLKAGHELLKRGVVSHENVTNK